MSTFAVGPFRGVRTTNNPYDDAGEDTLAAALNCYFQDPVVGGGVFQRPGSTNPVDVTGITYGGMYSHTADNGTVYNFVICGDGTNPQKVYRWPSMGASVTDVTPTNIVLPVTERLYFTSLNGEIIVNDGFQKPWRATNLGSTPITATPIEYQTPTNVLSRGTTDTDLANTAFSYSVRVTSGFGNQAIKSADAVGVTPGAIGQIAANNWGSILVELDTSTSLFVFTAAFNAGAGYASEALAIAALPARTANRWYVGYVTVQADPGFVWIAGTDAFAGGTTGNQAQTTNYYAGEGPAWRCEQQPVIYAGSVFFILKEVNDVYAQTSITWSEPNLPGEGFQQDGYDNVWTLTQTSAQPMYALAATNDTLYYFRETSIGAVSGTPGINFQGTATHDVVAGNVGCVNGATVAQYLNYIYFADQNGRPYRFAVGSAPEPIWTQAYSIYEAAQANVGVLNVAVIEPNLNAYLSIYVAPSTQRFLTVWDALTGRYQGTWTIELPDGGPQAPFQMAVLRDGATTASGGPSLGMMMGGVGSTIPLYKLATAFDNLWTDNAVVMQCSIGTGKLGYSTTVNKQYTRAWAVVGHAGGTPAVNLTALTSQQVQSSLSGRVLASAPEAPIYRVLWMLNNLSGRDIGATVSTPPISPATAQMQFFRFEIEATERAEAIIDDH